MPKHSTPIKRSDYAGDNRRDESPTGDLRRSLYQHIADCARLQKRVFYIGIATLGWLVTHSVEFDGALAKIIAGLAK